MNEARQRHVVRPQWRVDLEVHRRPGAHRYTAYQGCNRMRVPCSSVSEARHMADAWTFGGPRTEQHFVATARGGLPVFVVDPEAELAYRVGQAVTLCRRVHRERAAVLRARGWGADPEGAAALRRVEEWSFLAALAMLEGEFSGVLA